MSREEDLARANEALAAAEDALKEADEATALGEKAIAEGRVPKEFVSMDRTSWRLERLEEFEKMFDKGIEALEEEGADERAIDRIRTAFAYVYFEARKTAMM